jgi:predicted metal-binding membrane protein
MPTPAVRVLRHNRALSVAALVVLATLGWTWLFAGAGTGMAPIAALLPQSAPSGAAADMAMMPMPWTPERFAITCAMWLVMMVAMMLPSAAPMVLLYDRAAGHGAGQHNASARPASGSFLAGYLSVWLAFSLAATALQAALERLDLLSSMTMTSQSRWLSAAILVAAGIYQFSPLKEACLRQCQSPAQFLSHHYQPGKVGALRMGLRHGAYCVGCCWLLMALLFVGGVMNLVWIAILALLVAAEKLLRFGRYVALACGMACIGAGVLILLG